jgi:hypothetical protein
MKIAGKKMGAAMPFRPPCLGRSRSPFPSSQNKNVGNIG